MKVSTISSKGQITIPKSIQILLGMQKYMKVLIYIKGDSLVIEPFQKSIVEKTAGSLGRYVSSGRKGKVFEDILEETKRVVARSLS